MHSASDRFNKGTTMLSKPIINTLAIGIIITASSSAFAKNNKLDTDARKASYTMGIKMGRYIRMKNFNGFNIESLFTGIRDGIMGNKPKISNAQMDNSMKSVKKLQASEKEEIAKKNLIEGKRFMAENRKMKNVVQTNSGMQYKIITTGKGTSPKATDIIKAHYKGSLIDGTVFDSKYARKKQFATPVNRVIKGWTEALQMMKIGSKWRLFIPSELAYGSRSPSQAIPANSTLIFDIELLEIESTDGTKVVAPPRSKENNNKDKSSNPSIKTNRM